LVFRSSNSLILDTDTDTTASFVSHSGTGGIGHGHSLYSSFGSIKGHGMSQVVAVIFPSISDVIVHNHGLRSRALVPSDSTQHFVLYLQRLVLFQLHLRDVDRPSRVTTAPRIVELQAQTIGISVTEKNLYLAVVYLDFSRPGRSGSDRFVVEVGTKIRIHGSLVIGRC